jgi:hypothetical protein
METADRASPRPVLNLAAHGLPRGGVAGIHGFGQVQVRLIILFEFDCQWPIVTFFLNNTRPSSI